MFGRRLKKWYPVLLVLLFVAGGVGLMFLLPDDPNISRNQPSLQPKPQLSPAPDTQKDESIDRVPPLLDDDDREIEKDFPDLLELPDPIDIPEEPKPE